MNKNICNNCGKQGHLFYQCKLPIISYGIIVYRKIKNNFEYLMIRRKNSFGYIDFVRGKYSLYNIYQIQNIVDEMSLEEKQNILIQPFITLWNDMWGELNNSQNKNEEQIAYKKMELIKNGINIDEKIVTLQDIVNNSKTNWKETEWEFPKGRRNYKEKDLDCALREFQEETGISSSKIKIVENVIPFEEIFIGTNYKSYKHKYFLAEMNKEEDNLNNFQITEVSKLEWKSIDSCLKDIRQYNLEKKVLISNINKVLKEFSIYNI